MRNESTGSHRSRSKKAAAVTLAAAALAGAFTIASANGSASGDGWEAVAVLRDANDQKVGKVKFEGDARGTVVRASLTGITVAPEGLDAYHGFHLHAGNAERQCVTPFTNVGGHWNPTSKDHGSHAGDLPSILVLADGTGEARSVTGRFDPSQIDGRAVILHAGPDNFANIPDRYVLGATLVTGPDSVTKGTGDAGGRIACGIVELD